VDQENQSDLAHSIQSIWQEIADQPDGWLMDLEGQLAYVAGGALPLVFGREESKIWQSLVLEFSKNQKKLVIAGVEFDQIDLELIGEFYRYIKSTGKLVNRKTFHCIDERLADELGSLDLQVHEHCGACQAVHQVVGHSLPEGTTVEDCLLSEVEEKYLGKQKIYSGMPEHCSIVILIDFQGVDTFAREDGRVLLRDHGALPFQVSLPVKEIHEFIKSHQLDSDKQDQLLKALVNWNVQIARNIIGGEHNRLRELADQTIMVFDLRQADYLLADKLIRQVKLVAHGEEIFIR